MSYGLQLLEKADDLNIKYKNIWDEIDKIKDNLFNYSFNWDTNKCYAPYLIFDYLFNNTYESVFADKDRTDTKDINEIDVDLTWLTLLATWRRNKQVFTFDKYIAKGIIKTDNNFDLNMVANADMFTTLPYSNFFVNYPMQFDNWGNSDGFFVSWDYNYAGAKLSESLKSMELFLSLTFIIDNKPVQFRVFFNSLSFRRLLQQYNKDCKNLFLFNLSEDLKNEKMSKDNFDDYVAKMQVSNRENINQALLLVMYINELGKKKPQNSKKSKLNETEKILRMPNEEEKSREVQNWEVNSEGIKWIQFGREKVIAEDIDDIDNSESYTRERNTPTEYKKGTPKAPHTRKGHMMRYWVGSKKNPDERRLEEKWLYDTEINVKYHEDILITTNKII